MFSISSSSWCCVRFSVPYLRRSANAGRFDRQRMEAYLESKVLEEVCGSVGLVRLSTAAGIDPHADGRGLGPWRVLGRDLREGVNGRSLRCVELARTVKPLERVVDSVLEPWETGVARPRVKGDCLLRLTALMACLERRAVCRLSASLREAIGIARSGWGERAGGGETAFGWDG